MKITRKQLRRLIEGMIGYPDKPPVSAKKYLSSDQHGTKLSSLLQSDDLVSRGQGIGLGAALGDDTLDVLDRMSPDRMNTFIDDTGPLNKDEALMQSIFYQLEGRSPWREKQVESYFTTNLSGEEFEVVINGDILTDIYETIADGRDADAKKIAHDYLNTGFLRENPEVANWYNSNVSTDQNFQGYASFSDFYFKQKFDDIQLYGILPYEFDVVMWNRYTQGVNLQIWTPLNRDRPLTVDVDAAARGKVYGLAKSLGLPSQGNGSHPLSYFFYEPKKGEIAIG